MARKSKQIQEKMIEKVEIKRTIQPLEKASLGMESDLTSYSAEYRSRCGGTLRANREKLGLSTQEIASRLRLSSKQIEALEADNFAALPEATIVKGFIRNYAKLLKISAEPLLDAYNVIVPEKAPQSFTLHPSVNMKVTEYEKPSTMRYALLGLALVLGLGTWLFYQNYVQKPNPVTPTAELVPKTLEELPEVALPAAERPADATVTQLDLPESEVTGTPTPESTNVEAAATPQAASVGNSPIAPQPPANQAVPIQKELSQITPAQIEPSSNSKLEFNATQETWISVVDVTGKQIYNKILFAGNREVVEAKPPLNITVGNALGTTLDVNGKPVDLAPHTRTNVAHVKID